MKTGKKQVVVSVSVAAPEAAADALASAVSDQNLASLVRSDVIAITAALSSALLDVDTFNA